MTLSLGQFSYNGYTFGPGLPVQYSSVRGLRGIPPLRVNDPLRPFSDGAFPGYSFMSPRVVTMTLDIVPLTGGNDLETDFAAMAAHFVPVDNPAGLNQLEFLLSSDWSDPRLINCRITRAAPTYEVTASVGSGYLPFDVEFTAPDPVIYDSTTTTFSSATATIGLASDGLTLPQSTVTTNATSLVANGWPTSGAFWVGKTPFTNAANLVSYTGITGGVFTGCTGGTVTMAFDNALTQIVSHSSIQATPTFTCDNVGNWKPYPIITQANMTSGNIYINGNNCISWNGNTTNSPWTFNFQQRTVIDNAGNSQLSALQSGYTWPPLNLGNNTVLVTGDAGVSPILTVSFASAWSFA